MKRILGLLALVAVLTTPTFASAAEQIGVYVAPKFIYGYTMMDFKAKDYNSDTGETRSIGLGDKHDNAWGGALAIGYDFDKRFNVPIRAEVEYSLFSQVEADKNRLNPEDSDWNESFKQKFDIQTLFLNAYWDINTGTAFTPYVGAGIGMAFIDTKYNCRGQSVSDPVNDWVATSTGSKSRTNFAWNVGAGLGYDFNEYVTLDIGYRFVSLGNVKSSKGQQMDTGAVVPNMYDYGQSKDLYMHQVMAGLRITF